MKFKTEKKNVVVASRLDFETFRIHKMTSFLAIALPSSRREFVFYSINDESSYKALLFSPKGLPSESIYSALKKVKEAMGEYVVDRERVDILVNGKHFTWLQCSKKNSKNLL